MAIKERPLARPFFFARCAAGAPAEAPARDCIRRLRQLGLSAVAALLATTLPLHAGPAEPLKIVALGTSLTAHSGIAAPLAARLTACTGRRTVVTLVARSGATSSWGVEQLPTVTALRPDIVLIEFAINDSGLHRFMAVGRSAANLRAILARLRTALPEARTVVMAMSPASGARAWIRPLRQDYENAHRRAAADAGADHIDHGPEWAAQFGAKLEAAIPDGLHPTPEAAARVMVPTLARLIARGPCAVDKPAASP